MYINDEHREIFLKTFIFCGNCLICFIAFYCYSFRKYPLDELWLGELLSLSDYNSLHSY